MIKKLRLICDEDKTFGFGYAHYVHLSLNYTQARTWIKLKIKTSSETAPRTGKKRYFRHENVLQTESAVENILRQGKKVKCNMFVCECENRLLDRQMKPAHLRTMRKRFG
jgi:hypothetical protein